MQESLISISYKFESYVLLIYYNLNLYICYQFEV